MKFFGLSLILFAFIFNNLKVIYTLNFRNRKIYAIARRDDTLNRPIADNTSKWSDCKYLPNDRNHRKYNYVKLDAKR
jgi:hypothetical protein